MYKSKVLLLSDKDKKIFQVYETFHDLSENKKILFLDHLLDWGRVQKAKAYKRIKI